MQFKILPVVAAALSVQTTAYAMSADQAAQQAGQAQQGEQAKQFLSPKDVINTLDKISTLLSDTASTLTHTSFSNLAASIPRVVDNLVNVGEEIARDAIELIDPRPQGGAFDKSDQQSICDALKHFVDSNKKLVNTVVGRDGVFGNSFFRLPIAVVLKTIESTVNNIASGLVGTVPTCQSEAQQDLDSLNSFVITTINGN